MLDRARFRADDLAAPDIDITEFRLRGMADGGDLVAVEMVLGGLRVRPKPEDRSTDDRLKQLFRLQSADLRLSAQVEAASGTLQLRNVLLTLSGGTELSLSADVKGADLSTVWLAGAGLTALDLTWRSDGRLLRPVMEAVGEALAPGVTGSEAVDAARIGLSLVVDALPTTIFDGESRAALYRMISTLPQERGRLQLSLTVPEGIGAARLFLAGFADDPVAPATLARLFEGARLSASWQPGIAP